jgi:hypothetical protein
MISYSQAILSLEPHAEFSIVEDDYETLQWFKEDVEKPSEDAIVEEISRLEEENKSTEYRQERGMAYPSIQDQLDILYHEGYDGWKAAIQEVKDRYPKP